MSIRKYHLTRGEDHISGGKANDLFLAPGAKLNGHFKPTLTSADVLDGGKGIDTIAAALCGGKITPRMSNIENGVFYYRSGLASEIDLRHAKQMDDLTLRGFGLSKSVTVGHAVHVSDIQVIHGDGTGNMTINGIDAHAVKTENISFSNTSGKTMDLQNIKSGQFNALHIAVADSFYNLLSGDVSARSVVIDSAGTNGGVLSFDADKSHHHVSSVTVTGQGTLTANFGANYRGFNHIASFDSSANTGGVQTYLASSRLVSVAGGSGDDAFTINGLGGSAKAVADVSMGGGDDLTVVGLALDSAVMHFDGGKGSDEVWIDGSPANLNTLFSNFEKLTVSHATGSYALDPSWTAISLFSEKDANDIYISGSGLKSITGSTEADNVIVTALGGSLASKATVELDDGNDYLNLEGLALAPSTQHFDGGDGSDSFDVIGNVALISSIFENFEFAYIRSASGTYDFAGSGISAVELLSGAASAVTFNNVATGSELILIQSQTATLSLNIENAGGKSDDAFTLLLEGNVSLGSGFAGVKAVGLSNLEIWSGQNSNIIYLDQIGASNDYATLKLSGSSHLTVNAVLGSSSYIDYVNITNTAGIDMLGLLNGTKALSSLGVNIVGGAGADIINSGGGNNEIHGSLGADQINLKLNSGADVLVFDNENQSAYGSGDSVLRFSTGDAIDISALVTSVTSAGDVSSFSTGVASLSTNHCVAFFDTANDTLYIDINHDGQITAAQDMEVELTGFSGLQSWNLLV